MAQGTLAARQERKVVTVLFADLVGFTSRSEQLDPEDVRAFLSPYYARLRTELERFGAPLCYASRAQMRLGHDDVAGAMADIERAVELARLAKDPQAIDPTMAIAAYEFREAGEAERSAATVDEARALFLAKQGHGSQATDALHILAWTAFPLGRGRELLEVLPDNDVPWVRAARAFATGDLREAADICASMGARSEEARDRLWLAEALVREQRRAEADIELHRVLAFYRSVGASRYVREAEALLSVTA